MMARQCLALAVALVCAGAPLAAADTCDKEFASAEAFEEEVMDDDKVWAVVFHSAKKDPEGLAEAANGLMQELDGKVKVGCFDYKISKELAGEFGVRKFNLPQIRIFVSRARSPSKVSMKHDEEDALLPAAQVAQAVLGACSENKPDDNGQLDKITLALGGGGGDEL